jgi:hypothetical protein
MHLTQTEHIIDRRKPGTFKEAYNTIPEYQNGISIRVEVEVGGGSRR